MFHILLIAVALSGFSILGEESDVDIKPDSFHEVPLYDFDWEDDEAEYDQICEMTEYEKPSALMVWLRSVGGAMYVGLCSAREYMIAKWYAMQRVLGLKKAQENRSKSS